MSAPAGAGRLSDLDVAVPCSASLGRRERRAFHRLQVEELEELAARHPCAEFALEAMESLVQMVGELQEVIRVHVDQRAAANEDLERLMAILHRDANGGYSASLALVSVIRARL